MLKSSVLVVGAVVRQDNVLSWMLVTTSSCLLQLGGHTKQFLRNRKLALLKQRNLVLALECFVVSIGARVVNPPWLK